MEASDMRMAKETGTKRFRLKYDIIAHHFRDTFHPVNYIIANSTLLLLLLLLSKEKQHEQQQQSPTQSIQHSRQRVSLSFFCFFFLLFHRGK